VKRKHPLTNLETHVMALVSLGADPWEKRGGQAGASRAVSQALNRLKLKGFVEIDYGHGRCYRATPNGDAALLETFRCYLEAGQHGY
jgi:hypothetical protein